MNLLSNLYDLWWPLSFSAVLVACGWAGHVLYAGWRRDRLLRQVFTGNVLVSETRYADEQFVPDIVIECGLFGEHYKHYGPRQRP